MLAKSLVIFIGFGVIAGFAFGVYLIDVKNSSQLLPIEGNSLSIITGKSDFKKGEQITIKILNSGTLPITFSDDSHGLQITGLSGILMFSPEPLESISTLNPGDETSFLWDQVKNDGDTALEGLYKISAKGVDSEGNTITQSTTIAIWK